MKLSEQLKCEAKLIQQGKAEPVIGDNGWPIQGHSRILDALTKLNTEFESWNHLIKHEKNTNSDHPHC